MPRGLGVKGGIDPSDNIYAPSVLISSTILTEGRRNMILTLLPTLENGWHLNSY